MDVRELLLRLFRYVVLFLCAARSFAGTTDPNTPDAKYLEFGAQFPNVVKLRNTPPPDPADSDAQCVQIASAVLIAEHWAVTAAHVVENASENVLIIAGEEYPVPYVVWHRDYDSNNVGLHDVALCYSPKAFELKFYPALYRKSDEINKSATIAGFGAHGTFLTGACRMDEKRRAGCNKIDSAWQAVLLCSPSRGPGRFTLEFGLAPGDSGGGMFIGNELAGINSFVMAADEKADGDYGDSSAFTRVSLYADWIDSQIQTYEAELHARAQLQSGPARDLPAGK